jgi:predicted  nucleic acid-binding Zn-ribbon protein
MTMHADLKKLIRLQDVDLAIQELRIKTEAFPAKSKALNDKLDHAIAGVEQAQDAIRKNQSYRKELEASVSDLEAKISKYRAQLMSVKTNEEYKAMTKEIAYTEELIRVEEDKILALMEESELLQADLKAAEAVLADDKSLVHEERVRLEELNARDTATLDSYMQERATLEREISEDILLMYERVREARGGVALASASAEACDVCNVRMRPQVFQEVRKNTRIIACDSCNRILYDPENLDHPFEVV